MSLLDMSLPDLIGTLVGLVLTVAVFSYVLPGDNALFRISIHLFIGVTAGYAVVIAWSNVLWPQLLEPLISGSQSERLFVIFPLLLSGLLMFKISPNWSRLGNPAVFYMLGVGLATTIGGALMGTLLPQVMATINLFDPVLIGQSQVWIEPIAKGLFVLLGVVTSLAYFHFGARKGGSLPYQRSTWIEVAAWVGQVFIAIALGSIFAGVFLASLAALVERLQFLMNFIFGLLV
jgi:hypothetical protein